MRRTPITIRRRHDPRLGTRYGSLHSLLVVVVGGDGGDDDDDKENHKRSRESQETNCENAMKKERKRSRNSCSC